MPEVFRALQPLREWLRPHRIGTVALVPTMGHLHRGHLDLVRAVRAQASAVVASIYVNPTQFGPNEDLEQYPRTLEADLELLDEVGCDCAFVPSDSVMYPQPPLTRVEVPELAGDYCARQRPQHFGGVCQAVARLFNMVQPDVAAFGEKDYQQLQIVRRMTADLAFPVRIVSVPTAREPDGLAMSSRNRYLSAAERELAPQLYRVLHESAKLLQEGGEQVQVLAQARERLEQLGFAVEYIELAQQESLQSATRDTHKLVLLTAAQLGETRLIDNIQFEV